MTQMMHNSNKSALLWCNRIFLSRMRVSSPDSSTKVAWRVGTWPLTAARWIRKRHELWFHINILNAALTQLSLDYDLFAMALGLVFILVSPPRSFRFNKVAAPRSQNRTGHCRALAQGTNNYQCIQAPIHLVCIFLCSHLAIPSLVVCSAHFKMPR